MPTRSLPIPLCSDMYWVSTDLSQYYTCCAYLLHSQRFSLHYWFFFFCCGNSSSQKRTTIALTIIFPCWAVPVPVSLTFFLLQGRPLRQISTNPSLTTLGDCSQFSSYFSISIGSSATSTGMLYFFSLKRYKTTLLTSYGTPPPYYTFTSLLFYTKTLQRVTTLAVSRFFHPLLDVLQIELQPHDSTEIAHQGHWWPSFCWIPCSVFSIVTCFSLKWFFHLAFLITDSFFSSPGYSSFSFAASPLFFMTSWYWSVLRLSPCTSSCFLSLLPGWNQPISRLWIPFTGWRLLILYF